MINLSMQVNSFYYRVFAHCSPDRRKHFPLYPKPKISQFPIGELMKVIKLDYGKYSNINRNSPGGATD